MTEATTPDALHHERRASQGELTIRDHALPGVSMIPAGTMTAPHAIREAPRAAAPAAAPAGATTETLMTAAPGQALPLAETDAAMTTDMTTTTAPTAPAGATLAHPIRVASEPCAPDARRPVMRAGTIRETRV